MGRFHLSQWLFRRLIELAAAFVASLAVIAMMDTWTLSAFTAGVTLAMLFTYAVPLFYMPLSAALWIAMSSEQRANWRAFSDSVFFLAHGYVAMCIMYNGLWAINRAVDPSNPYVIVWIMLAAAHLGLAVVQRPKRVGAQAAR